MTAQYSLFDQPSYADELEPFEDCQVEEHVVETLEDAPVEPVRVMRPYQAEAIRCVQAALQKDRSALMVMATGCHARGQGILMFDGSVKKVEDVAVGDRLMGPDSTARTVLSLARGYDSLETVVPTKGSPWTVNRGHILTLVDIGRPNRNRSCNVIDVSLSDWHRWSTAAKHGHKLFRVPVFFPPRPDPLLDPYVIGLWIGDGTKNLSTLCVSKPDEELRAPLCIPDEFKLGSQPVRSAVLAGLLDSDGHLTGGGYDFVAKSESLSNDVAFVARSLGLAAYVSACRKSCQGGSTGDYWRVSISGDCRGLPLIIHRKRAPMRMQKKSVLRTGFSVRYAGVGEYFGFELDGDKRYVLDDFTVTHNTGKTYTFAHIARDTPGKVLVLAHREELIEQARDSLQSICGERIDIEKASQFARDSTRVVVGCVPTMKGRRLEEWSKQHFKLVIIDECHHAASRSYRSIVNHFADAKILGVTATPDRADKKALGDIFHDTAFVYDIIDAIRDGYLVNVRAETHELAVDLSAIKTTAGDLNQGELDEAMGDEHILEGVAKPTFEAAGDRSTIVFTTSVANAHAIAKILNALREGCARAVDGETPPAERREIMAGLRSGAFQFLVNCGIATEGFDAPRVSCISIGRPTKSRSLYVQMVGRGLRLFEGKTDCLLLDFAGNGGKHDLCTPENILGGEVTPVEKARARKVRKKDASLTIGEALAVARAELITEAEAKKRAAKKVKTVKKSFDPFSRFSIDRSQADKEDWQFGAKPPTEGQLIVLNKNGIDKTDGLTFRQASAIIGDIKKREQEGRPRMKQEKLLKKFDLWAPDLTFREASALTTVLFQFNNGQRRWTAPSNAYERAGVKPR